MDIGHQHRKHALLIPGQGAQRPGMLRSWLELPQARTLLTQWSSSCDVDLIALGTDADARTIADTAVAQPLLTAMALLAVSALGARPSERVPATGCAGPEQRTFVAGHSVGELGALATSGVISMSDAVALAATRGRAMADACQAAPTGMAAILGGDHAEVRRAAADADLEVANVNSANQIVVAGLSEDLARLAGAPPADARVVPLRVAGAFHSRYMASAAAAFADHARSIAVADPQHVLISNFDGRIVRTGEEAIALVAAQMTRTVRWDLCQRTLDESQVTVLLELPPTGTLGKIAQHAIPGVEIAAIRTPADCAPRLEAIAA